jgi:hypothetical protein
VPAAALQRLSTAAGQTVVNGRTLARVNDRQQAQATIALVERLEAMVGRTEARLVPIHGEAPVADPPLQRPA